MSYLGKRCLKLWLCHPLRNKTDIEARLDAIDDFVQVEGFKGMSFASSFRICAFVCVSGCIAHNHPLLLTLEDICATLTKLPDLERVLSRIHSGNCKIKEFLSVLDAFRATAVSCHGQVDGWIDG